MSGFTVSLHAQNILSLHDAIDIAVQNYPSIKAKNAYARAASEQVSFAKRNYLPNINFSAQQDYGTINGTNGPLYGFGGLAAASSGPALPAQNWNPAFGGLYLTNVNWDFFAFGKTNSQIRVAEQIAARDAKDYEQEVFEQKIKVAAAYLNLVAARQLTFSYSENLKRADSVKFLVEKRAENGLVAGVDSSLANAEYSNAKIALTKARDKEQELKNILIQEMGMASDSFEVDTAFIAKIPADMNIADSNTDMHPLLQYYKSRIAVNEGQVKYLRTFYYPTFSLVGVLQTRGSGFANDYAGNLNNYTADYWSGVKPDRTNYLLGIGVTWNITQPIRISRQVSAQRFIGEGLQAEYDLASQQIKTQLKISNDKIANALSVYEEAPVQVKAASDAYLQKSVLYKNGLTDMVDVTQASYSLIRAETDKDIANNNVWQALLLKAAALGDFKVFESQL
jgi:outer membrane protein TolC